jgi:ribosome-binding factor A
MPKYRQIRINDEMMRELSEIIRSIKDPRIQAAFISITNVDCTPDLKYAKIYYSVITKSEEERADIARGFKSASGFIRKQLAERLNLRMTPELKFLSDESMEKGADITKLIRQVEEELQEIDAKENEDDE